MEQQQQQQQQLTASAPASLAPRGVRGPTLHGTCSSQKSQRLQLEYADRNDQFMPLVIFFTRTMRPGTDLDRVVRAIRRRGRFCREAEGVTP